MSYVEGAFWLSSSLKSSNLIVSLCPLACIVDQDEWQIAYPVQACQI